MIFYLNKNDFFFYNKFLISYKTEFYKIPIILFANFSKLPRFKHKRLKSTPTKINYKFLGYNNKLFLLKHHTFALSLSRTKKN